MDLTTASYLLYGSAAFGLSFYFNSLRNRAISSNNDIASTKIWKLREILEEIQINNKNPNFSLLKNNDDFTIFKNLVITGYLKAEDPLKSNFSKNKDFVYLKNEKFDNFIGGNIEKNGKDLKEKFYNFSQKIFVSDIKNSEDLTPPLAESKLFLSMSNNVKIDIKRMEKIIRKDEKSEIFISSFSALKQIFPFRSTGFHIGVTENEFGVIFGTPVVVLGNLIYNKKDNSLCFQSVEKVFKDAKDFFKYLNRDTFWYSFFIWATLGASFWFLGKAVFNFL